MKKIFTLILSIFVFFIFSGCAKNNNISLEGGRNPDESGGYSIRLPEAWQAAEMEGVKYKTLTGPPVESGFNPNIQFFDDDNSGDLSIKEFVDLIVAQQGAQFPESVILKREDFSTFKKVKGEKVVINTFQFGVQLRQTFFCFPGENGKKMIINCTVLEEDGKKYEKLFDETVKTFDWIK